MRMMQRLAVLCSRDTNETNRPPHSCAPTHILVRLLNAGLGVGLAPGLDRVHLARRERRVIRGVESSGQPFTSMLRISLGCVPLHLPPAYAHELLHLQFLSGVGDGVGAGVGCAVGLGVGAGVAWVGSVVGFDCATARVAARRSASACSA